MKPATTLLLAPFFAITGILAIAQTPLPEPQLASIAPIGARRNGATQCEIRGQALEGAYALWTDCPELKGTIQAVEEEQPPAETGDKKQRSKTYRIATELAVSPGAALGIHSIRVISPRGISNAVSFVVHDDPAGDEARLPKEADLAARRLNVPAAVGGRIAQEGEVDSYVFHVDAEQELRFEVVSGDRLDAQITIYEPSGSWLDPQRWRRLAHNDEPNAASRNKNPNLTYRFSKPGRYVVSVASFLGRGGPDYCYLMRVAPPETPCFSAPLLAHPSPGRWDERSFTRRLDLDRLVLVAARTVPAAPAKEAPSGAEKPALVRTPEREPNDGEQEALEIAVPSLIEGTIEHSGDVDWFRFTIADGARLAFEIETSELPAPLFTPRITVVDASGHELVNNVYAYVQGSGEFIEKTVEPKVTASFERGGEYRLRIEDVTSRHGGRDFRYRIMVRRQLPHMGRVEAGLGFQPLTDGNVRRSRDADHLNLEPGQAKKITVLTEQEEGYDGEIALAVEGLPVGVDAFPATEVEPDRPGVIDEGKKQRYRPVARTATILFVARSDAPLTKLPAAVCLKATPVVRGRLGTTFTVHELPLMVVRAGS
jgi:hypothetical protein